MSCNNCPCWFCKNGDVTMKVSDLDILPEKFKLRKETRVTHLGETATKSETISIDWNALKKEMLTAYIPGVVVSAFAYKHGKEEYVELPQPNGRD